MNLEEIRMNEELREEVSDTTIDNSTIPVSEFDDMVEGESKYDIVSGLIGEDYDKFKDANNPDVKEFLNVMKSMEIRSLINNLGHQHREMMNKILYMLPMGVEESKIIMARLGDMTDEMIDNLSDIDIEKILTIDDVVSGNFTEPPDGVTIEYKRDVLKLIAATKLEIEEKDDVIELLEEKYNEITDERIESIVVRKDFDQYVLDYYTKQLERTDITDEIRERLMAMQNMLICARTLEPIKANLYKQLEERGSKSLLEGFRTRKVDMMDSATNNLSQFGMKFPFQLMINLEENLFGAEYKEYNNLFIYILARHIHHQGSDELFEQLPFISTLITNLVTICREMDSLDEEFIRVRTESIRDIIDKVINTTK